MEGDSTQGTDRLLFLPSPASGGSFWSWTGDQAGPLGHPGMTRACKDKPGPQHPLAQLTLTASSLCLSFGASRGDG